MADKVPGFITEVLECKWSNLLKPDDKFGESAANHNITVVVTESFDKLLKGYQKKLGAKKINGMFEKDGVWSLKAKTKQYVAAGVFPCFDSQANPSETPAMGGDTVKLKLQPFFIERDKSLSFYLNGVQIITKGEFKTKSSGFTATDGGFVAAATKKDIPAVDDDLPF